MFVERNVTTVQLKCLCVIVEEVSDVSHVYKIAHIVIEKHINDLEFKYFLLGTRVVTLTILT